MARYTCPSCGSSYNGKKCRNCLYEAFPDTPVRKVSSPLTADVPSKRKLPSVRERKPRQQHPLIRFLVLLTLIYSVMPMLRNWGLELKAIENESNARTVAAYREQVMAEENKIIFHQESGITIFTGQDNLVDFSDSFCLYVQNDTAKDVTIAAGEIEINGCLMPHSSLVCPAGANAIGKGWLKLDAQDLKNAEIQKYRTLSFTLTALQNGRILFDTEKIQITAGVDAYE